MYTNRRNDYYFCYQAIPTRYKMKTTFTSSAAQLPRILTCGGIVFLLMGLFLSGSVQADILVLKQSQPSGHDWNTVADFDNVASCTGGYRVVNSGRVIRTPQANSNPSITAIYLGYTYDVATGTYTVVGEEARSQMGLKNQGANTITIENLYLGNGQVLAWGVEKPTLAGKIFVEGARSEINAQDTQVFYISSQIVKVTPDSCLDLVPFNKNGGTGEIYFIGESEINCPLNLKNGKIFFDGKNTFGSDFALTLQDGTGIVMGADSVGTEGTTITINGTARYVHKAGTLANKVNHSNVLIPEGSTLNAKNNYDAGATGSMVFAGELQGVGALVVDTVGTSNTNSLTLGHSENSFTGTVSVNTGKLQFTVKGQDNVTYTGTNALINAKSVTVASNATIDVGATTQTFNNLSGAGTVTVSDGGSLTLNYTSETIFSGIISSTEEVIKTGNGTLRIDGRNDGSTNIDCPLNVNQGQLHLNGTDVCGSNFALTLQDGTSVLLSGNNIGKPNTTITVNGSVRYGHWQNTSANKVCYSNLIVTEGSTLNAINNYDVGAKGSMVFAGELQGAGALVVDTKGSTNTNSLTLGHPENSFTGTVSVNTGKLQFTVLGYDNETYTGTNALINAESVTVASGATIDVGATTQTFNNLSGAGTITISEGGALTLNNNQTTLFTGSISGSGKGTVAKTGAGTLLINAAQNAVDVQSLVVSSGRLDMKSYFKGDLEINNSATFSPGNSIGKLEQTGNFTLDSGATLLMEIGGTDAELNDQLIVSGDFSIGNDAIIELLLADNSNFTSGDKFTARIIANTLNGNNPADGDVTSLFEDYLVPGWPFYDLSVTKEGNVYSIHGTYDPNAVPEPSTWALLVLGVVVLFLRKRVRS